jgi:UDP-N-acetyl-D-mannosaminuronate dehydrogenase
MLELYIFNKNSPVKKGLSFWEYSNNEPLRTSISFNLDRFKCKDSSNKNINDFIQELNYIYKENEGLKLFFEKLSGSSLEIEIIDNYHHLLCFDPDRKLLILDSKIQFKFIPLYLFAFYYSFSRRLKTEDEIYKSMFDFFLRFDQKHPQEIIDFLQKDKSGPDLYDAGSHLLSYFQKVLEFKNIPTSNSENKYLCTQLLRNRALVGKLPYDILAIEKVFLANQKDAFSAKAVQELFWSAQKTFDKDYAKIFYNHLSQSLKAIGVKVVAQRGSRVAHEQGPILINAGVLNLDDEFSISIKKIRSHFIDTLSKLEELINNAKLNDSSSSSQINSLILNINILLDSLIYLCDLKQLPQARLEKNIIDLKKSLRELFGELYIRLDQRREALRDSFWAFFDTLKNHEKNTWGFCHELEDMMNNSPTTKKTAVIYVQRPSSKSGHFIPRILMGQKLYIETDAMSQELRLDAIPYNFVCPDFELIADGVDSFFENASISIVTDKDSGSPHIKWENAEDLALSMAPGIYKAIKASQQKGKRFHYQLETTLLGPLIDLFITLLETEMNNIASIERYSIFQNSDLRIEDIPGLASVQARNIELEKIEDSYLQEILSSARFVFDYYILEDELEDFINSSAIDSDLATIEFILSMRDVQMDIARLCLLKRNSHEAFVEFEKWASREIKLSKENNDFDLYLSTAKKISDKLKSLVDSDSAKLFVKKYIRYPASTARKEYLQSNSAISKVVISSSKTNKSADYFYDFTVAPSRIDFGRHVVASVTTLMGRILGANDNEALQIGKEFIDLVSKADNSYFNSAGSAGTVKVIENTCRAIQYAKAISFQSSFQQFNIDGLLARLTINSRNSKSAGLHVMEYGTMASTGYCITKEPLFILLGFAINSQSLLEKLGITNTEDQQKLIDVFKILQDRKKDFKSTSEWEVFCYEKLIDSPLVQEHLSDSHFKWLPSIKSMTTLLRHLSDNSSENRQAEALYSQLASKLIEFSRIVNETGIIQRIQIMNSAVSRSKLLNESIKNYSDLKVGLNASYKGNVSDERENANQYLIAYLLHEKQYLKNASLPEVAQLIDFQINNYSKPLEIRIIDPLVDPEAFMGGELKNRADNLIKKLISIDFEPRLNEELIKAMCISYGSDYSKWRVLQKRISQLPSDKQTEIQAMLSGLEADFKYLEIFTKGFYKNPLEGFQGLDIIQLNSDHDEIISALENLTTIKRLMKINNPDSLLILVDNPQQAKKPFFDFDKSLEWMALGGTIASHMISDDIYESWRSDIERQSTWAKLIIQKQIMEQKLNRQELSNIPQYQELIQSAQEQFFEMQKFADLNRDLIIQKYKEAQEMQASLRIQKRYVEWINCLARIQKYKSINEIEFSDWLVLGGRWVLNGQSQKDIDYIVNVFETQLHIKTLGKRGYELLSIFVNSDSPLDLESRERKIEIAGSTKEADLIVGSAGENLKFRLLNKSKFGLYNERQKIIEELDERLSNSVNVSDALELEKIWDNFITEYFQALVDNKSSKLNSIFAKLLKVNLAYANLFVKYNPQIVNRTQEFISSKNIDAKTLNPIFGDHKTQSGIFSDLAQAINLQANQELGLDHLARLGEMFNLNYLIFLTFDCSDENEIINKLAMFFDQYLNIHEEDYPPYMFHSLCAGSSYGFNQTYYMDPNLRTKMFKFAYKTGIAIYKLVQHLVSKISVLKYCNQEYKDALVGDYENGIIAIGYQHETICIEERLWDCMRALRNFVRNYHDKHPLPIIIKGSDATVDKLFKYKIKNDVELCWVAGLASPGKHSWDLNCVLRSPLLRDSASQDPDSLSWYIIISCFTPYLTPRGEIKQIYTSFRPELVENQKIQYLAPFSDLSITASHSPALVSGHAGFYACNADGFVHALVMLNDDILPKPDITMSAHTHSQYINNFTRDLGVPETWSLLSMQQMYSKTEVPRILKEAGLESLKQIDFTQKEFSSREEIKSALLERLRANSCDHIDSWILKASKDSGGRGVSPRLSLSLNMDEILDFIYNKTRVDDVVMQEFVPNNAKAFIKTEFVEKIEDVFIESGIDIRRITPLEKIYFAMRSFQSISGIKGYLFSVNIGNTTVNAGQGAKMFYGEPIYIMPIYIAGKIQMLLDEQGDAILKQAIPLHAEKFARAHDIAICSNNLGSTNCFMFNALFDYIPYLYVTRKDKDGVVKKFKVECQDNSDGGLDYFYIFRGEKITLISKSNHQESILALEDLLKASANNELMGDEISVDIDLANIEFNSGLGQANLLQKAINDQAPDKKDLFLEWTEDLGAIGMAAKIKSL